MGHAQMRGVPGDPVKIGIIFPLTGEAAGIGQGMQNGARMAYESLSAQTRQQLRLYFEDDGMQPRNTLSAFNRLVAEHDIDVVVNASSGTGNALAPVAEKKEVPLMAIASDPKVVEGRRYVVNFWVSPDAEMQVLLPEVTRRGYQRIARITTISDFSLIMKKSFDRKNQGASEPGVNPVTEIVYDEEVSPDERDFKTIIAKIKRLERLDAVLPALMPGQIGEFARQLRQAQVEVPMFGFEFMEDANEVRVSQGALVGAWYVNASDAEGAFASEYRRRFPGSSLFGVANAHDAILIVAKAVENGMRTREQLNMFIHHLHEFSGALGTYSATQDNCFTLPASIKVVTADGFVPVDGGKR